MRQNIVNSSEIRGTLGLKSKGIEIYFPLSPSLVLCLLCEHTYRGVDGKNIVCSAGNVENINHLQVYHSDRFIFSNRNDFSLVADMVKNGEV